MRRSGRFARSDHQMISQDPDFDLSGFESMQTQEIVVIRLAAERSYGASYLPDSS
jgi:hypothetical protein